MFPALKRRTYKSPLSNTHFRCCPPCGRQKNIPRRWIYYSPTRITAHLQILSDFLFLFSHRVISTFGWQGTHNANHEHTYLEQLDGVLICTNAFIIVVYNAHEKETLSSDHGLVSQVGPVVARGGGSLQLKFRTKNIEKKRFSKGVKIYFLTIGCC